jgi:hypothetical protein
VWVRIWTTERRPTVSCRVRTTPDVAVLMTLVITEVQRHRQRAAADPA